jgi:hypothetical protein
MRYDPICDRENRRIVFWLDAFKKMGKRSLLREYLKAGENASQLWKRSAGFQLVLNFF